jgi:hypothetical protein
LSKKHFNNAKRVNDDGTREIKGQGHEKAKGVNDQGRTKVKTKVKEGLRDQGWSRVKGG